PQTKPRPPATRTYYWAALALSAGGEACSRSKLTHFAHAACSTASLPSSRACDDVLLSSRPVDISETLFSGDGEKRFLRRPQKGEMVMTKFGLIGAAGLSLMLASPAMAMHRHHDYYGYSHAGSYSSYGGDFDRKNTFN